jgi:hypothetical protein
MFAGFPAVQHEERDTAGLLPGAASQRAHDLTQLAVSPCQPVNLRDEDPARRFHAPTICGPRQRGASRASLITSATWSGRRSGATSAICIRHEKPSAMTSESADVERRFGDSE